MSRETLGQRIKRRRLERKLSLRETAKLLGVSASYLSLVESGGDVAAPTEEKLNLIAKLLNDDVDELMCLARRVSEDVKDVIAADPKMPALLRTVRDHNVSADELLAFIKSRKPKEEP